MSGYYRAADCLTKGTIELVMKQLVAAHPEWEGGVLYFPADFGGARGFMTKKELAYQKALGVTLVLYGHSVAESAVTVDASEQTIRSWVAKYGAQITTALDDVREGEEDG